MADETSFIPDVNLKIRDLEERQRLTKGKLDLLSKNFTDLREDVEREMSMLKLNVNQIQSEILKIKEILIRTSEEIENRAKKSEVELVAKQLKILKPLTI